MKIYILSLLLLFFILLPSILFDQKIIKIIPNYILIDTDKNLKINDVIKVFRYEHNNEILIGEIKIVKFDKGRSAAKILLEENNYNISIGDYIKIIGLNYIQPKREASLQATQSEENKSFIRYSIGYSANIPSQLLGICLFSISNKIGFYGDLKFGGMLLGNDNSDYYENISINKAESIFGDKLLEKGDGSFAINLGITQNVLKKSFLYGGLGYSSIYGYRRYYDPFEILGDNGKYWIDDPDKKGGNINLFGGIIILTGNNVSLLLGGCSKPAGFNFGISYVSPIRFK